MHHGGVHTSQNNFKYICSTNRIQMFAKLETCWLMLDP
uniref:Uncharacterized protein n=1 Tax=Lepeophtheirus salmonis TaxID=72036 RepID=A0A0K2U897_LEPSM